MVEDKIEKMIKKILPRCLGGDEENIFSLLSGESRFENLIRNRRPLWECISRKKPDRIMEIGFGHGYNSIYMRGISNAELYIFDILNPGELGWRDEKYVKDIQSRNYEMLKEFDDVYFVKGDTRETLAKKVDCLPDMDVIFIDGGHGYEVVANDWEYSKRLMHSDSVCFFHDYEKRGVKKVVDRIGEQFSGKSVETDFGPPMYRVVKSMNSQRESDQKGCL